MDSNIRKMKKKIKREKRAKIKIADYENVGILTRKKRMRNCILIAFLILILLGRENCMDTIYYGKRFKRYGIYTTNIR